MWYLELDVHDFITLLSFYLPQELIINWDESNLLEVKLNFLTIVCLLNESFHFNKIVFLKDFPHLFA